MNRPESLQNIIQSPKFGVIFLHGQGTAKTRVRNARTKLRQPLVTLKRPLSKLEFCKEFFVILRGLSISFNVVCVVDILILNYDISLNSIISIICYITEIITKVT